MRERAVRHWSPLGIVVIPLPFSHFVFALILLLLEGCLRFHPYSGSSAGSLMREECKWKISLAANDQTSFRFGYTKCYDPVLGMLGFSKKSAQCLRHQIWLTAWVPLSVVIPRSRMIKSGELKTCHMWQALL